MSALRHFRSNGAARRSRRKAGAVVWFVLISTGVLQGCGDPDENPAWTVTDSSGVMVVMNRRPLAERTVAPPESLLLTVSATEAFGVVRDVQPYRDDSLVVVFAAPISVRVFSRHGDSRPLGRLGDGPDEYRSVSGLFVSGDTVIVHDVSRGRLLEFAGTGDVTGQRLTPPHGRDGREASRLFGRVLSGELVVGPRAFLAPMGLAAPGPAFADFFVLDPADGSQRVLGRLPHFEFQRPRGESARPATLGAQAALAVVRGEVAYSYGRDFVIDVMEVSGTVTRSIRLDTAPGRILPNDLRALLPPASETLERDLRTLRAGLVDELLPAVGGVLLGDPGGYLWVPEYPRPAQTSVSWQVIGRCGRWLTTVQLPRAFQPTSVNFGTVLGINRDELGQTSVSEYAFELDGIPAARGVCTPPAAERETERH